MHVYYSAKSCIVLDVVGALFYCAIATAAAAAGFWMCYGIIAAVATAPLFLYYHSTVAIVAVVVAVWRSSLCILLAIANRITLGSWLRLCVHAVCVLYSVHD